MRKLWHPAIIWRMLLVLAAAPLLSIAPRPHAVTQSLQAAQRILESQAQQNRAGLLANAARRLPWRVDLWEPAGLAALRGQDAQAAVRYLEMARHNRALSTQGMIALGDAYIQQDQVEAALNAWDEALMMGALAQDIYRRELQVHRAQADYPAIAADLQQLLALQPVDLDLRYQLGLLLAVQQPEQALASLAQVADLDAVHGASAQTIIDAIRSASFEDEPAFTFLQTGRALASIDEWALAAEAFRQVLLLRPDVADAWAFLAEARQRLDTSQSDLAWGDLEQALALKPQSLAANTLAALYWQRQGKPDKALEYLNLAASAHPDNPALQAELGGALADLGELEAASRAYQRAAQLAPRDSTYLKLVILFCIKHEMQLRSVALPTARRIVLLTPQDPEALDLMGQVLLNLEDLTSAERFLQQALQAAPDHVPAHLHLGQVYMLQNDPESARREWEFVQSSAPGSASAVQAERLLVFYFP